MGTMCIKKKKLNKKNAKDMIDGEDENRELVFFVTFILRTETRILKKLITQM